MVFDEMGLECSEGRNGTINVTRVGISQQSHSSIIPSLAYCCTFLLSSTLLQSRIDGLSACTKTSFLPSSLILIQNSEDKDPTKTLLAENFNSNIIPLVFVYAHMLR